LLHRRVVRRAVLNADRSHARKLAGLGFYVFTLTSATHLFVGESRAWSDCAYLPVVTYTFDYITPSCLVRQLHVRMHTSDVDINQVANADAHSPAHFEMRTVYYNNTIIESK